VNDNWSLGNKKHYGFTVHKGKTFGDTYLVSDIETLRNEIINDIDIIDCTDKSKLKKWEIIEEVLEIIDKRFGVDEDVD